MSAVQYVESVRMAAVSTWPELIAVNVIEDIDQLLITGTA